MANPIILIPLADGHSVTASIINSINNQTLKCDLVTVSRPENKDDKRKSEGEVRKALVDIAPEISDQKFFIMMDRSVVLKNANILKDLSEAIDKSSDTIVHVKCKRVYVPENHKDVELFAWPRNLTFALRDAFGFGRYIKNACWCSALEFVCSSHKIKQAWLDYDNTQE